jgi:Ig-like domain-containing protein
VVRTGIQLSAFRITASSPPTLTNVWTVDQGGYGCPFVTSTDGTNDVLVWGLGADRDQQLHAFDGGSGAVVYGGGGEAETMSGTRRLSTAIAANSRVYVAADNRVYAFTVLGPPKILSQPSDPTAVVGGNASFQVSAAGSGPLSYQWFFDAAPLPGGTNSTLLLTNVQPAQAGLYSLVISNGFGSVTSVVAQLSVLLPPVSSELIRGTTTVSFKIDSLAALNYILEYKDTLGAGTWTPVPPAVPGSGGTLVLQDTNAVGASRFYRIRAY